jgi:hypothetical protein
MGHKSDQIVLATRMRKLSECPEELVVVKWLFANREIPRWYTVEPSTNLHRETFQWHW